MAWTTPKTDFAPGDVLTAAQMNNIGGDLTALRGDWGQTRRESGNFTLNNTSWQNLDTGLDITLAAATNDIIEVAISALTGSEAVDVFFDCVTVVSGTATTSFATGGAAASIPAGHQGIQCWRGNDGVLASLGGCMWLKLTSGDIASSTVTLRLRYRTGTATNKNVYAVTNNPFVFTARNHGPVEI